MRIKTAVLSCLIVIVILTISYDNSWAKSKGGSSRTSIGVVSIKKIFQDSMRSARFQEQMVAEQDRIVKELEKLKAEIDAEEAGLKTLKIGSDEYMQQVKDVMKKRASSQAQQEFYKRQLELKEQQWIEKLYKDILDKTAEVAKARGLDLVFEKSEPDLSMLSGSDLMRTIDSHKVIYSGGSIDISKEVIKLVDVKK